MILIIEMQDERLDSFILIFKDRSALDTWESQIQALVASYQRQPRHHGRLLTGALIWMSLGAQRRLHGCLTRALTPPHQAPSTNLLQGSVHSTMSSFTSQASVLQMSQMHANRL